jgi:hypothetical protein
MVSVWPDGTEEVVRFRVKSYRPPHRTLIEHELKPRTLRQISPNAQMWIREENIYSTT